jgi:hypothetical protein
MCPDASARVANGPVLYVSHMNGQWVYYTTHRDRFLFASEIKALFAAYPLTIEPIAEVRHG